MKNILISIFLTCSFNIHAQDFNLEVFTNHLENDSLKNNRVIIGFNSEGTIGLDSFLGEEELKNVNIASIHRKEFNFDCSYDIDLNPIYFSEDLSLNKDLRNYSNLDHINNSYFQIKILNEDISQFLISLPSGFENEHFGKYVEYMGLVYNCDSIVFTEFEIEPEPGTNPIFAFNFSEFFLKDLKSVLVKFRTDLILNHKTIDYNFQQAVLFPNPTSKYFSIKSENSDITHIEIYDITNKIVKRFESSSSNKYGISNLNPGVYLILIHNNKNQISNSKLVIH